MAQPHPRAQSPKPPQVGAAQVLAQDLLCVLAPNASPMTYWGTNSYILGRDSVAVIDPGPNDPAHETALLAALEGRPVSHILITHSHLDHSPLARPLSERTGAPIFAFGDSRSGRSAVMASLAKREALGGGEGADLDFTPDVFVQDQDIISGRGWTLTAHHTPGHFGNHLTFQWGQDAFTGDHIMGWASSLVSPPDGDLTDFMTSCVKLSKLNLRRGYCGHGAPIADLHSRIAELISHRRARERQIRDALLGAPQGGGLTPAELTALIYTDIPSPLLPMAQRNVLAHLVDLCRRDLVASNGPISATAKYFSGT